MSISISQRTHASCASSFRKKLAAAVLAAASIVCVSGEARADDPPPFIPWTSLLPSFTWGYEPSSSNICVSGHPSCVDSVIAEMEDREAPLDASCNHNEIFALTYLRVTEHYQVAATTPGFFSDPNFINHQDAVFAQYYFDAWDNWRAGNLGDVPRAWQIAFSAADNKKVTGLGNLLLGMSAHVNRDLPYTLATIGLVKPDGTSRKPDHDKVNEFLNTAFGPVFEELAARFDPKIDDLQIEGTTLDEFVMMQVLMLWREIAWRNAELLVNAPTPELRAIVEANIERVATIEADLIYIATAYRNVNLTAVLGELTMLLADPFSVAQAQVDRTVNLFRGVLGPLLGSGGAAQRDQFCATHG